MTNDNDLTALAEAVGVLKRTSIKSSNKLADALCGGLLGGTFITCLWMWLI